MLRSYFQDTVILMFDTGPDTWGEPTWFIPDPIKVHIKWKSHMIRNLAGEQVVSRAIVYIIYDWPLTHKDKIRITQPRIGTIDYTILDLTPGKDFSDNHQECHIQ